MEITTNWLTKLYLLVLILLMIDYGHALASYRITIKTASTPADAGTMARVRVTLYGVHNNGTTADSPENLLPPTVFQPGSVNTFEIEDYYGVIYKLKLGSDNTNSSPNWLPIEVIVEDLRRNPVRVTSFPMDRWLDVKSGLSIFLFSPVDGQYTPWSEWSECDAPCQCPTICNGTQVRTRTCNDPPPFMGGRSCEDQGAAREEKTCTKFCVIDGGISDWSGWSECSKPCETGEQNRTRTCTNPAPLNGGRDCTESRIETRTCNTQKCPVDGGVSEWGEWSNCSKTCDTGQQIRSRTCDNPEPQHGGQNCTQPLQQTQDCNTDPCNTDNSGYTQWSTWSTCSATCGGGRHYRTRTCPTPAPSQTGNCEGAAEQMELCNTQACRGSNGTYECGLDLWLCDGLQQCINAVRRCDGQRDCVNNADELNCDDSANVASASLAIPILIVICILAFIIAIIILIWCIIKRNKKRAAKVIPTTITDSPTMPNSGHDTPDRGIYGNGNAPLILRSPKQARLQSTNITDVGHYNAHSETPYILNLPGNEVVMNNKRSKSAYDYY